MISRCLGLKETLMLSLQLGMTVDYLIPTDLITHLCVGRKEKREVWSKCGAGVCGVEVWLQTPICAHIPKLSLTPVKECERHTRIPAGAPCLQLHTDLIQP